MDLDDILFEITLNRYEKESKLNLSDEQHKVSLDALRKFHELTKAMKQKSTVYNGRGVIEISKDMESSMYGIASAINKNDNLKVQSLIGEGTNMFTKNKDSTYHLNEMFKHFIAFKCFVCFGEAKQEYDNNENKNKKDS